MSFNRSAKTPALGEPLSLSVGVAGLVFLALALLGHAAAQQGGTETVPFGEAAAVQPHLEPAAAPTQISDSHPVHGNIARGVVKGAQKVLQQVFLEPEGAQPGGAELLSLVLAVAGR